MASISEKTRVNLPVTALIGILTVALSWLVTGSIAQQRNIDKMLLELKYNREMIKNHCDSDNIRTSADVREAMRN